MFKNQIGDKFLSQTFGTMISMFGTLLRGPKKQDGGQCGKNANFCDRFLQADPMLRLHLLEIVLNRVTRLSYFAIYRKNWIILSFHKYCSIFCK
jgi:hypothetical protein